MKTREAEIKAEIERAEKFEANHPASEWGIHSLVNASEVEAKLCSEHGAGFQLQGWIAVATEGPRAVRLKGSSWVDTSAGDARHYYATLSVSGLSNDRGHGRMGYGVPPTVAGLEIRIEKKVTRAMMRDGGDWEAYKPGDWTYRFETEKGAADAGRRFFAKWFRGEWELIDETLDP